MSGLRLSVIVVSRHRRAALLRCLKGLMQQDQPATEVIVVADPGGVDAVKGLGAAIKTAAFDTPNISAARNLGLLLAAGDVVAFIDDDAVPEPTWASRLTAPFEGPQVVAATGFIRGRNGISFQWRASEVDAMGMDHPLEVPADTVTLRAGTPQRSVKTQGTNCAFRAQTLRAIGGFDPAFRFFLDEADVNLRMAPLGLTAIVPMAQVHHGYLASDRRRGDRVPLDLAEIAASTAVFLRRHAPDAIGLGHERLIADQRARAMRHMIAGRIEPRDVTRLMASLARGWHDGLTREIIARTPLPESGAAFQPLADLGPRPGALIAGRIWQRAELIARAKQQQQAGRIVTVLCLSPGWRRHHQRFDPAGFWIQTGGIWGRALREGAHPGFATIDARAATETLRLSHFRPIS